MHAALAVLLGLNGLRVSEACGANIDDLGFERGHRTLQIIGQVVRLDPDAQLPQREHQPTHACQRRVS